MILFRQVFFIIRIKVLAALRVVYPHYTNVFICINAVNNPVMTFDKFAGVLYQIRELFFQTWENAPIDLHALLVYL